MILGLPEVAHELEERRAAVLELDLEPVERVEQRPVRAVDEPLRSDERREDPLELPGRRLRLERPPRGLPPGVVHADADPPVAGRPVEPTIEAVRDPPARVSDNRSVPGETDLVAFVANVEAHLERVVALFNREFRDRARDGAPARIANRGVDPAGELRRPDSHVPEVAAVEKRRHRARS